MARRTVVGDLDVEGGRRLIEALDQAGFPVQSAFWYLNLDSEEWRLVISTPIVDTQGPLKAYQAIRPVLHNLSGIGFRVDNIAAVGAKDRLVAALRKASRRGPSLEGLRLTRNVINGEMIEDAYIYRL